MARILILNGPNLNMLGMREPEIYGTQTLADVATRCEQQARELGFTIDFRQSNHEGELVTWIQETAQKKMFDGLVINAAAYSHTSIAIHDALKLLSIPIIEVHISNPKKREKFRRFSYVGLVADHVLAGHGVQGYAMALVKLKSLITH